MGINSDIKNLTPEQLESYIEDKAQEILDKYGGPENFFNDGEGHYDRIIAAFHLDSQHKFAPEVKERAEEFIEGYKKIISERVDNVQKISPSEEKSKLQNKLQEFEKNISNLSDAVDTWLKAGKPEGDKKFFYSITICAYDDAKSVENTLYPIFEKKSDEITKELFTKDNSSLISSYFEKFEPKYRENEEKSFDLWNSESFGLYTKDEELQTYKIDSSSEFHKTKDGIADKFGITIDGRLSEPSQEIKDFILETAHNTDLEKNPDLKEVRDIIDEALAARLCIMDKICGRYHGKTDGNGQYYEHYDNQHAIVSNLRHAVVSRVLKDDSTLPDYVKLYQERDSNNRLGNDKDEKNALETYTKLRNFFFFGMERSNIFDDIDSDKSKGIDKNEKESDKKDENNTTIDKKEVDNDKNYTMAEKAGSNIKVMGIRYGYTGYQSIDDKIDTRNEYLDKYSLSPNLVRSNVGYNVNNFLLLSEAKKNGIEINGRIPSTAEVLLAFTAVYRTNVLEMVILYGLDGLEKGIHKITDKLSNDSKENISRDGYVHRNENIISSETKYYTKDQFLKDSVDLGKNNDLEDKKATLCKDCDRIRVNITTFKDDSQKVEISGFTNAGKNLINLSTNNKNDTERIGGSCDIKDTKGNIVRQITFGPNREIKKDVVNTFNERGEKIESNVLKTKSDLFKVLDNVNSQDRSDINKDVEKSNNIKTDKEDIEKDVGNGKIETGKRESFDQESFATKNTGNSFEKDFPNTEDKLLLSKGCEKVEVTDIINKDHTRTVKIEGSSNNNRVFISTTLNYNDAASKNIENGTCVIKDDKGSIVREIEFDKDYKTTKDTVHTYDDQGKLKESKTIEKGSTLQDILKDQDIGHKTGFESKLEKEDNSITKDDQKQIVKEQSGSDNRVVESSKQDSYDQESFVTKDTGNRFEKDLSKTEDKLLLCKGCEKIEVINTLNNDNSRTIKIEGASNDGKVFLTTTLNYQNIENNSADTKDKSEILKNGTCIIKDDNGNVVREIEFDKDLKTTKDTMHTYDEKGEWKDSRTMETGSSLQEILKDQDIGHKTELETKLEIEDSDKKVGERQENPELTENNKKEESQEIEETTIIFGQNLTGEKTTTAIKQEKGDTEAAAVAITSMQSDTDDEKIEQEQQEEISKTEEENGLSLGENEVHYTNLNDYDTNISIDEMPLMFYSSDYASETYFSEKPEGSEFTVIEGLISNDPDIMKAVAEDIVNGVSLFASNEYDQERYDAFCELLSEIYDECPDMGSVIFNMMEENENDIAIEKFSEIMDTILDNQSTSVTNDDMYQRLGETEGEIKDYVIQSIENLIPDSIEVAEHIENGVEKTTDPVEINIQEDKDPIIADPVGTDQIITDFTYPQSSVENNPVTEAPVELPNANSQSMSVEDLEGEEVIEPPINADSVENDYMNNTDIFKYDIE